MSGDMTVGMLTGFYMAAVNFLQAESDASSSSPTCSQILEADLQRLDDVFDATEDLDFFEPVPRRPPGTEPRPLPARLRLKGRIELRNVTFGYQDNREPLLEDFSLAIEPRPPVVAIVGPSGVGQVDDCVTGGRHPPAVVGGRC